MSVSTPPRLSASAISRTRLQHAPRRSRATEVERRACRRSRASAAWRARAADAPAAPDRRPARPSGAPRGTRASARPFALCCAIRSGSVLVPRSTSHESNGLRIAPAAFWMNCSHSMSLVAHGDDDAADAVAVAVQVLRRAVHDEVGAELDRPLHARAGERVVDDQHERRAAVRDLATPPRGR